MIYNILLKISNIFKGAESNYLLTLPDIKIDENIENIYAILLKFFKVKNENDYKIIDYEKIFLEIFNLYSNEQLNELCKLNKIANIFKYNKIKIYNVEKLYNKIHTKGLQLIKNKQIGVEEIMDFIFSQDAYYYEPKYLKDELRDPIIFSYIPIIESDKNSQKNITILKKKKIWEIYE